MTVVAGIILAVIAIFIAAPFWSIVKSPQHLSALLTNETELKEFVTFIGPAVLLDEAGKVSPVFGSYEKNVELFTVAHAVSLRKTRNMLLVFAAADTIAAYFLSPTSLFFIVPLFILPAFFAIANSAKNNNATHIHTVLLNLIRWHQENSAQCRAFCTATRPELKTLHSIASGMKNPAAA